MSEQAPATSVVAEPVVTNQQPAGNEQTNQPVEGDVNDDVEGLVDENDEKQKELTPAEKRKLKKLKIKYNGKEIEEELPFEIDDDPKAVEYMRKQLQLAKMGHSKAQEYSQLEKEVREFIQDLKTNPKKALANEAIGVDLKKLAAEILEEEISNASKTPEQIEKEKLQEQIRLMQEERDREKSELQQKQMKMLEEQEFQRYDSLLTKAFEDAKIPKNEYMIKRMADMMIHGINKGVRLEPADVLPIVQEEMYSEIKNLFGAMPAESLKEFIGKDNLDKIRKFNLSKKKTPPPATKTLKEDVGTAKKQEVNDKKLSFKDFFGV